MPFWAEGEFALAKEQIERAIAASAQPVKWGTGPHEHDLYAMLTDAAARQRDLTAILKYAPVAEQLAGRDHHQLYLAIIHRAWAVAQRLSGEYREAETRLAQALEISKALGARWQIGLSHYEYGELEADRHNDASAREQFSLALVEFEAMRAAPQVAATRQRLRDLTR